MRILAPMLAAVLLSAGCRPPKPPEAAADSSVVATVGGTAIHMSDLDAEIARRGTGSRAAPKPEQVLEEMIDRSAMIAHAREIGLDRDRDVVRKIENLLIAELKQRELQPRLRGISRQADPALSGESTASSSSPEQLRLAVLQLTVHARTTESRRKAIDARMSKARELALRLPADEPGFGALAVDYSDHQESRYVGGDRGWFDGRAPSPLLAPEVLAAGIDLRRPGDISDLVRTERGIFLVRLIERVCANSPATADSAVVRRHRSIQEERRRIEAEFAEGLRRQAGVELNSARLACLAQASSRASGASEPRTLKDASDAGLAPLRALTDD